LYLTIVAGLVNTLLAFTGQQSLHVYFIVNSVAYLSITLLSVLLNPRARRALEIIGYMLFSGIVVIVIAGIMDILSDR
jgi:uncharacterized membrane protein